MNSFKVFSNFSDGLKEIVEVVPNIKSITESIKKDINEITPKDLSDAFVNIVMNDFPYIDFRSPAISISYREVGFKSRSALSFGWKYISTGEGNFQYSFRISFFSHSDQIKEIESKLAELGWTQNSEKHNYFPYKNNTKFNEKKEKFQKGNNFKKKVKEEVVEAPKEVEQPVAEEPTTVEQEEVKNTSSEY